MSIISKNKPATPTEGDAYFDTKTNQLMAYHNGSWYAIANKESHEGHAVYDSATGNWMPWNAAMARVAWKTSKGGEIYGIIQPMLTPTERIMTEFAQKVNNHSDMNVKMVWQLQTGRVTRDVLRNDPDYWAGVAYGAYEKKVISHTEFTDILLALQASGAKSDYFKAMAKEVVMREI